MNLNSEKLKSLSATMVPCPAGWALTVRNSPDSQIKKFYFQRSDIDKLGLDLEKSSYFESQRLEFTIVKVYTFLLFRVEHLGELEERMRLHFDSFFIEVPSLSCETLHFHL